jgi:hypothetical protein
VNILIRNVVTYDVEKVEGASLLSRRARKGDRLKVTMIYVTAEQLEEWGKQAVHLHISIILLGLWVGVERK